ncbi:hypothetical protein KEM54_005772, partial [Ascosphaera aggregata]
MGLPHTTPNEQAYVQQVSKTFRAVCRDNARWRTHCYEALPHGAFLSSLPPRRHLSTLSHATISPINALTTVASLAAASRDSRRDLNSVAYRDCQPQRSASYLAAQWDPSYEGEEVDWYTEYVTRNAPISVEWLSSSGKGSSCHENSAIKGMALLRDTGLDASDRIISPLENGAVCLWDLNRSQSTEKCRCRGKVVGLSKPGILSSEQLRRADSSVLKTPINEFVAAGDLVSVDSKNAKAYIAIGDMLNEFDIPTLSIISRQPFPRLIFALSQETEYPSPLSVASISELSIYDPRQAGLASCSRDDIVGFNDGSARLDARPATTYTMLHQPGPLSVLHLPSPNVNTIALAGRFPSVLLYDRRNLSRVQKTSFSGASLCGMTAIPATIDFPFSTKTRERYDGYHTLIACGEYKGRGSLEFFALPHIQQDPSSGQMLPETSISREAIYQNRHTASRSKILSVACHGTTIALSDADGYIKWVERDGRTEVRRFDIKQAIEPPQRQRQQQEQPQQSQRASFRRLRSFPGAGGTTSAAESALPPDLRGLEHRADATQLIHDPYEVESEMRIPSTPDVVRKILPIGTNEVADNEVLIWTGDQVGRLRFVPHLDEESDEESDEKALSETEVEEK